MKEKLKGTTAFLLLVVFIALFASIIFSGCNTYQKQLNKFQGFAMQHTGELAKLCSTVFPVKDSLGKATVDSSHRANNINYQSKIDSLQEIADNMKKNLMKDTSSSNPCAATAKLYQAQINSLTYRINQLKSIYKPCKPDTLYIRQTVYRTDQAALNVCMNNSNIVQDSLKIVKHDLQAKTKESKTRFIIIFILAATLIGGTILKFTDKI